MSHLQQESFQIILMVPLLPRSVIFPLNLNSQGRTNREGALLRYFCRRGAYYSVGRTNREGRTNRGSTVSMYSLHLSLGSFEVSRKRFTIIFIHFGRTYNGNIFDQIGAQNQLILHFHS